MDIYQNGCGRYRRTLFGAALPNRVRRSVAEPVSAVRISRLVRLPDFSAKLLLLAALTLAGLSGVQGQNGCSCTNCPQFLYDNFQGNFYIQVQNAGNPTLGQNGQGVCGVVLHFNHEYLGDLSVQLTSPAGQTVTLIQPVGMFGETDGASWNITFVPCSVPADPDPGFAEVWTNDQPWGILGNYTGSYYPNAGCLEDFNQGPVNGQWTLSVTDGLNEDVGNFFNYSILFCDPSGVECTTCEANAGNLLQSDISACVGDSTLRLNLPPTYAPPQSPPPPAVYDYSYVVASGGIIIKYDTVPDLTGLPSGKYSVCGLSYLAADSTEIPPPDGMFTVTQLAAQLNSATPPFCGNITPNCVAVAILPPAPAVYDTATICAPACYDFYGKKYCATGQYAIQVHQNGCSFQAYLNLNVLPLASDTLEEIVCAGQCSGTPGFDTICTPGWHSRALPGVNGCDSLVVLHLTVLAPDAAIESPGILTCDTPQQTLSSAHPASGQNFSWTAFNGGNLAGPVDLPQATADKPGDYRLVLCAVENGASCCDTAHVTLSAQQDLPAQPPAIYGLAEICPNSLGNWRIDTVPGASGYVWTFPAGVNVLSGFNTDSIQLRWGAGNAGALCVRAENACGLGPAACLDIGLKPAAGAPDSLSAPAVICAGDTTLLVAWHATAAQSFIWQFPPNAQAIGAVASDSVWLVWTPGDPGLVCVRAAGDCDTSAALCKELWVGELPGTPVLAGPDSVCGGSISVYSALPATGAEKYVWEITGGQIVGNADSSAITVYWPAQGGMGQVCLSAQNACGIGPAECRAVAIRAVEPAFAGADTVVCGNAVVLQAIASPAGTAGVWRQLSGPGLSGFADSLQANTGVKVTLSGNYVFEWRLAGSACPVSDTIAILFHPALYIGAAVIQCTAANDSLQLALSLGGGTAPFQASGLLLDSNLYDSPLLASGSFFEVVFTDSNGCSATWKDTVSCPCLTAAGGMDSALLRVCPGGSVQAAHLGGQILDGNDTLIFVLHTQAGGGLGKILGQNASGVFQFGPGMDYGSTYYISAVAGTWSNGQLDLADPCLSVAAGQPVLFVAPVVVDAGLDASVCGEKIVLDASPPSGFWTLAAGPAGAAAPWFEDSAASQSTVEVSQPGTYVFVWNTDYSGCSFQDEALITFNSKPAIAAWEFVCDSLNVSYTVQVNISGGAPPYSVNNTFIQGDLFLSAPVLSGDSFFIKITDTRLCSSPSLGLQHFCSCGTSAGVMAPEVRQACAGDSIAIALPQGIMLDHNDTLAFVLHTLSGTSLGQVLAQNQSGVFTFSGGMQIDSVYYVSVVAGNKKNGWPDPNDPCYSVAAGQPVVFKKPPGANAGISFKQCGLTAQLTAEPVAGAIGQWAQESGPGLAMFNAPGLAATSVSVQETGVYIFRWTVDNGLCSASDTMAAVFLAQPEVKNIEAICQPLNNFYTLAFSVAGGLPPYLVDGLGGALNGGAFLSALLPNNGGYAFTVVDANGCATPEIAGQHGCGCATFSGTMDTTPGAYCALDSAVALWHQNAVLAPGDTLVFVLHDQPGTVLGNILHVRDAPVFYLAPGMQTGTVYYISAVAVQHTGGAPDWNDPCISVCAGQPVLWRELPEAQLSGDTTVCLGSTAHLFLEGAGQFPVTVYYTDGTGAPFAQSLSQPGLQPVLITPAENTIYRLLKVVDSGTPTCSRALSDSVWVQVRQKPQAGTVADGPEYCQGAAPVVRLPTFLSGNPDAGEWQYSGTGNLPAGVWSVDSAVLLANELSAGLYEFHHVVSGGGICPDDSVLLPVNILPVPTVKASAWGQLDCLTDSVLVQGEVGPSDGAISLVWHFNGQILGGVDSLPFWATQPGVYQLRGENSWGCQATDAAEVLFAGVPIEGLRVQVGPVRCYGERNGRIQIDSVLGGTAPFLFSWDGSSFENVPQRQHLPAGIYSVEVEDAAGCRWSEIIEVPEPPEIKIDLGPDIEAALGDSVYLMGQSTYPAHALDTVIWEPLLDSASAGTFYQAFLAVHSRRITVQAKDGNGCLGRDSVRLIVDRRRQIYLPNVFMPGSKENGYFELRFGPAVQLVKQLKIFDRWGNQVFETGNLSPAGPLKTWDGSSLNQEAPAGVYTYFLTLLFVDGAEETFTGSLTLLR